MTRPSSPRGGSWPSGGSGRGQLPSRDDDGWRPSTAVYSSTSSAAAPAANRRAFSPSPTKPAASPKEDAEWAPAGPRPAREQRAVRAADRRTERSVEALQNRNAAPERGLTWWMALLLVVGIAALGAIVDSAGGIDAKRGFNIGIVLASVVAIIAVKRSHMFPVVIAPPIVYSAGAFIQYYIRRSTASSGLSKRQVFLDAAANFFVYGFPAIATATAAVLIVAGIRLITRK